MAVIKIVPFPGPKGDPGDSSSTVIPLPSFLSYTEGRDALPTLNSNFGWNANGLWFGNAGSAEGGLDSYPVYSTFTMAETDKVVVTFNVDVESFCSDMGICVYLDGTIPQWAWGINETRIAAQFNCPNPQIYGLTIDEQSEATGDEIGIPGMYQVVFTYDPTAETEKVIFQYFNEGTELTRLTLNEALPSGNYRIGFASDNNSNDPEGTPPYRTYISDLDININNEETLYFDTLQGGNSGSSADTADFVFSYDGEQSTMTIHNHDMLIQTTRDDTQDADIDINSADDIWITSNDTLELTSVTDEIRLRTDDGANQWRFGSDGVVYFPATNSFISSGVDGSIVVDGKTATFSDNYQNASIGIADGIGITLTVNEDTLWFASNTPYDTNVATITFADATTVQTSSVYDATSQGTSGVVFQWVGPLTKTFEETYPLTITGNIYADNSYIAVGGGDAGWQFASDGQIKFPLQTSNNRTGTGEVFQFGNSSQQSIITGSKPTADSPTAQRLVIAGQDGVDGTSFDGEGGDLYLWAGVGGGSNGSGGDIKVDAGNGTLNGGGGTIKVRGGYSVNSNGGFVEVTAGDSSMGNGGNVTITAGNNQSVSEAVGGSVNIYAGGSADNNSGGSINLSTYQNGKITINGAGGEFLNDSSNPNNQIATIADVATPSEASFAVNGGSLGTQPTFDGAPLFSGSYVKTGPLVHFEIQVDMDNITSFGSGQYYVDLPFPSKYGYKFRDGCLHDASTGRQYAIGGHVAAESSTLELFSTDTQSGAVFDIDFTATSPITLAIADNFHIAGTYVAEEAP